MAFTDIFIRRPVLATVVSLLIVLLGLQAFNQLTIRQYPQLENALITVTTAYPGANAEVIQGYITQPLQQSLASADGVDYISSVSRQNPGLCSAGCGYRPAIHGHPVQGRRGAQPTAATSAGAGDQP